MPLRLGVAGLTPAALDDVDEACARRIHDLGFVCVGVHFLAHDPFEVREAACTRVRDLMAAHGITIVQSTGYAHYRLPLIHPDSAIREQAARTIREGLRIGAALGAQSVLTGPGSMSTESGWAPHPDNFSPQAFECLVETLRSLVSSAEYYGTPISIEGHLFTTVNSPERMVELIDAVGSRFVQAICDPVNYIASLPDYYDTAAVLRRFIVPLAGRIACAHAKDSILSSRMTLHIDEGAPGEGGLDYVAFLKLMEQYAPDAPVIIEHMPLERIIPGTAYLVATAERAGVALEKA